MVALRAAPAYIPRMRGRVATLVALSMLAAACSSWQAPSEVPHHDDVTVLDETGWLLSSGPWAGTIPADIGTSTALFNPVGEPETLVVTWLSGVCVHDRAITLTQREGRLSLALDMGFPDELPDGAGCPAMGVQYAVGLRFDRILTRDDVSLDVRTHL